MNDRKLALEKVLADRHSSSESINHPNERPVVLRSLIASRSARERSRHTNRVHLQSVDLPDGSTDAPHYPWKVRAGMSEQSLLMPAAP